MKRSNGSNAAHFHSKIAVKPRSKFGRYSRPVISVPNSPPSYRKPKSTCGHRSGNMVHRWGRSTEAFLYEAVRVTAGTPIKKGRDLKISPFLASAPEV